MSNRRLLDTLTLGGIRVTHEQAVLVLESVHDESGMVVEVPSADKELALWIHSVYQSASSKDVPQYKAAFDDLVVAAKDVLATRWRCIEVEVEDYHLINLYVNLDTNTTFNWEGIGFAEDD